ncbi:MAG: phosphate ABC transporter permease PstA [Candidatus Riflebacteria bacterium]|nr:phosphate ABC transporter permease PstA [Candidatus Riflebacteria bacterium]
MDKTVRNKNLLYDRLGKNVCRGMSLLVAVILTLILVFLFVKGIKHLTPSFFFSAPIDLGRSGGILPIILSTMLLAFVSLAIAIPLGVGTAVYLTEYTKQGYLTTIIRFGSECLAGIPSIIFGLFGFMLFVVHLRMGWSVLAGGLTLACMVLPTIIRTSEEAIKSVPANLRYLGYSLGATKFQTIIKIVLPQAKSGIITGIILALGRVIGETACVIFTAGISMETPSSIFDSGRSMAVHFYILAREGLSLEMAYTTALTLVICILFVNVTANFLIRKRT